MGIHPKDLGGGFEEVGYRFFGNAKFTEEVSNTAMFEAMVGGLATQLERAKASNEKLLEGNLIRSGKQGLAGRL
jgi:hypothetical protein